MHRGRHRRPLLTATTHSPTLRAPLREWVADTWAVIRNMIDPVPAPETVETRATVSHPDRPDTEG